MTLCDAYMIIVQNCSNTFQVTCTLIQTANTDLQFPSKFESCTQLSASVFEKFIYSHTPSRYMSACVPEWHGQCQYVVLLYMANA